MLDWISGYLRQNESRLRAAVDVSAKEMPFRLFLMMLVYVMLGRDLPLWLTLASAALCLADDAALVSIRARLARQAGVGPLFVLALFKAVGASSYAAFLGYARLFSPSGIGQITALVVLAAVIVELSSPKARSHPFALLSFLPFWAALFGVMLIEVIRLDISAVELALGVAALVVAAAHMLRVFVENLRNIRQLETETERANAANAQKVRTLGIISHEIRTPLHAIYGTAQLLQSASDPAEIRRLSQVLLMASADMKLIVDDVIDYERTEAGRTILTPEAIDPCALVAGMADLFRSDAAAKGLTLKTICAPELQGSGVMLDQVRVRQVLSNLLSNAIKFTAAGTVTLRLEPDASGGLLCFRVADTGQGIPAECREKVFLPHQKPGPSDRPEQPGAGLGLSISRLLARRMGGMLTVGDAVGGGAEFTLSLPLRSVHLPDPVLPKPVVAPPAPSAPVAAKKGALSGLRVLVVDDVDINREVLRAMLERHGASVIEAEHGQTALDVLDQHPVDVVLLDNAMPVMTGQQMLQVLRAHPGPQSAVTVIGISAGTLRDECEAFIATGLDGFLSKPVAIPDLIAMIVAPDRASMARMPPPVMHRLANHRACL